MNEKEESQTKICWRRGCGSDSGESKWRRCPSTISIFLAPPIAARAIEKVSNRGLARPGANQARRRNFSYPGFF